MVRVHSDAPIRFSSVIPEFYHLLPDGLADKTVVHWKRVFPAPSILANMNVVEANHFIEHQ